MRRRDFIKGVVVAGADLPLAVGAPPVICHFNSQQKSS
jgi:hypothetical protein